MKPLRILLWTALTGVGVYAGGSVLLDWFGRDLCGNQVVSETVSPDGEKKLVVFRRDCGATTDFSTQASVLPAQAALPNDSGNVFVSDTNHGAAANGRGGQPSIVAKWESSNALLVTYHPQARVFKAESRIGGVNVRYGTSP